MPTERTHTLEGLLAHLAAADCFITAPHPALECGIVTAWWRSQVEADTSIHRHHEDATGRQVPGEQIT
jgi:hypothetical protein